MERFTDHFTVTFDKQGDKLNKSIHVWFNYISPVTTSGKTIREGDQYCSTFNRYDIEHAVRINCIIIESDVYILTLLISDLKRNLKDFKKKNL